MNTEELPHAPHRDRFFDNGKEVIRLLEIHEQIAGDGPGYKHNVEVLNKSAIVLLVATWESYIEELALNCFEYLLNNCKNHANIPNKVLSSSCRKLRDSKNELDIWKLAGEGWRDVLLKHKEEVINKYIKSLNTPKASNIDELFESLLGMKTVSSNWAWKGMTSQKSILKLEKLIKIRGEIAHTVNTSTSVKKTTVKHYEALLNKLAMITHNRCVDYLADICDTPPWTKYSMGDIN